MEVLYMAENELSKAELWIKRIQDFYSGGLSRKEWCQEHQISLSTFSCWLKKINRVYGNEIRTGTCFCETALATGTLLRPVSEPCPRDNPPDRKCLD